MKISFQREVTKNEFVEFNVASFPNRKELNKKIIEFRYFNELNTRDSLKNNVIAVDDDESIIAQALYHPASYYFQNEKREMEWGFDLFVRPDKRADSVGLHMFDFIKQNKTTPIFASGVGEKALKIEKFYGYHIIGALKKYYKIVNPLFLISGILRKEIITKAKYPQYTDSKRTFEKVSFENIWNTQTPYNKELLEFERDEQFLKWRFYSESFDYTIYKENIKTSSNNKPLYFVVRTVKIKRITVLLLVDYRYDTDNKKDFKTIVKAASAVAQKLFLPIVVTGSSHRISDKVLEEANFKITGRDRPIICNKKEYKVFKSKIEERNFIFSTLADTDGEYLL